MSTVTASTCEERLPCYIKVKCAAFVCGIQLPTGRLYNTTGHIHWPCRRGPRGRRNSNIFRCSVGRRTGRRVSAPDSVDSGGARGIFCGGEFGTRTMLGTAANLRFLILSLYRRLHDGVMHESLVSVA